MTPEQIEFHRKRFENWFIGDLDVRLKRDSAGNYTFMNAYAAWNAWISAIESIEVELDTVDYSLHIMASAGQQTYQEKVIESIQSLGLKIKDQK